MSASPVIDVTVDRLPIRLGQFLKFAGLLDTGADAKEAVESGEVVVNGDVETRRGRRLEAGDVVRVGGGAARVVGVQ